MVARERKSSTSLNFTFNLSTLFLASTLFTWFKSMCANVRSLKADTHEGFCSWSMLQGHAPGAKLLLVYQRFQGHTSSSGAEFPPRKMLHDIQPVKYLGASSRGKLSELENAPSCVLTRVKWAWSMLQEQNPSCVLALKLVSGNQPYGLNRPINDDSHLAGTLRGQNTENP